MLVFFMFFFCTFPLLWMCFLSIKYVASWDAYWALIIQSILGRFVSSGDFVFGCLQYNLSFLSIFTEDDQKIPPFHRSSFSTTVLNLSLMCCCSVLNWGENLKSLDPKTKTNHPLSAMYSRRTNHLGKIQSAAIH